jgi:pSer/pThr/pTyr-binding forkhead associated (FHA) protein
MPTTPQAAPAEHPAGAAPIAPGAFTAGGTRIGEVDGRRLFFIHQEGWSMELVPGDVLGRTEGNHADRLGLNQYISRTHAIVTREADGWRIIDQNSSNKTFVNGKAAAPGVPVPIKTNDFVQLGNWYFRVREA